MKNLYQSLTKCLLLTAVFCAVSWAKLPAQWNQTASLPGLNEGAAEWGDFDNDGDLDLALAGIDNSSNPTTNLYTNDGGGSFTLLANTGIMAGVGGKDYLAWGDYNNDGLLDLAVLGGTSAGQAGPGQLYANELPTNNNFNNQFTFPSGIWSTARWADFDNDGDLDLLAVGKADNGGKSNIYENNNAQTFMIQDVLPGITAGSGDCGDYDNDGDIDVLITGKDSTNSAYTQVYRNDGNFTFTNLGVTMTGVYQSMGKFADFDNDGNLDIVISGYDNANNPTTEVYEGDGAGAFTLKAGTGLMPMAYSSFAIGDVNADGLADLAMIGDSTGNLDPVARIFLNNGNFTFTAAVANIPATTQGGICLGDFDRNGDLDVAMTGLNFPTPAKGGVFKNNNAFSLTDINAGLAATNNGDLAWGDYNNDGMPDLVVTGFSGNTPTTIVYKQAPMGTFTPEANATGILQVLYSSVDWGDYNNDGNLDLAVMGNTTAGGTGSVYETRVYNGDGNGGFAPSGISIPGTTQGAIRWGDFDMDGNLDLAVIGDNGTMLSKIYKGNGTTLTDMNAQIPRLNGGSASWADYDNDGDLDLLVSGSIGFNNQVTRIYRYSDSTQTFSDISAGLQGGFSTSVDWADYDQDGLLDFAWSGRTTTTTRESKIYRQGPIGTFTDINATLQGVEDGSVRWQDLNQDGFPELLVLGWTGTINVGFAGLYLNNQGNSFVPLTSSLTPSFGDGASWGDYNNDGIPDLVAQGFGSQPETRIYRGDFLFNDFPVAPQNFAANLAGNGSSIKFSWDPATDPESPSDALTYQLMVGVQNGSKVGIVSPMADSLGGLRTIALSGPVRGTNWTLKGLQLNTSYCASILSIDPGLESSPWSTETCLLTMVVGIDESLERTLLTAWPNPTSNMLHIAYEGQIRLDRIEVLSLNGQVVRDLRVNGTAVSDVNVSDLSPGMYIVRAHAGEAVTSLKFVKQ